MNHSADEARNDLAGATTLGEALRLARGMLRASETATPDLDARILLAHVLDVSSAAVLAYSERTLTPEQATDYASLVARRIAGEPVAYLTGHREFMGLDFHTDARALIPRPETELLVEAALADIRTRLQQAAESPPLVADIGTGSGAIAIAVAALEPRLPRIYATDVSAEALALSQDNARRLGVSDRVVFLLGDLLDPLPEPVDILLGNLPYVAPHDAATLPVDVRLYEPEVALYSPDAGLQHIQRLIRRGAGTPASRRDAGARIWLRPARRRRDAGACRLSSEPDAGRPGLRRLGAFCRHTYFGPGNGQRHMI